LDEEWVKSNIRGTVCEDSVYDEGVIRNKVDRIQIVDMDMLMFYKNGSQAKVLLHKRLPLLILHPEQW
jgi:hypothetical protein